jgi:hypothetical protein
VGFAPGRVARGFFGDEMTAAILTKKQTQAQKILDHIRKNPGCSNRGLFQYSNAPWARIYEYTSASDVVWMGDTAWKEKIERVYVMRNGRRHVTYFMRKIK